MKVAVAHPFQQHSFKTATALEHAGMLEMYFTTIYLKSNNLTGFVFRLIGKTNQMRAQRHSCAEIDDKVIQFCEGEGLLFTFLNRFFNSSSLCTKLSQHLTDRFGKKVAKFLKTHSVDALIMYDTTALECFEKLKIECPGVRRILDMSAATVPGQNRSMIEDFNVVQTEKSSIQIPNSSKNTIDNSRYLQELADAQAYIVASEYTRRDLIFYGVPDRKIHVISYGVNFEKFYFQTKKAHTMPLRILYVGRVTYKKGVHHLLSVIGHFSSNQVQLTIVGAYDLNGYFYQQYKNEKNVNFLGFVTRNKLPEVFMQQDVLVVPSLSDGFGLVVLEGMSCGLPVIASDHTGAADLIEDGKNGFSYHTFKEKELEEKIKWFIANNEKIESMAVRAKNTAQRYTWERYEKAIGNLMHNLEYENETD